MLSNTCWYLFIPHIKSLSLPPVCFRHFPNISVFFQKTVVVHCIHTVLNVSREEEGLTTSNPHVLQLTQHTDSHQFMHTESSCKHTDNAFLWKKKKGQTETAALYSAHLSIIRLYVLSTGFNCAELILHTLGEETTPVLRSSRAKPRWHWKH